jgi:hypothetical protein
VQVDAPNATPEQIRQLGEKVQEECPVAKYRKTKLATADQPKRMEWVPAQLPSNTR